MFLIKFVLSLFLSNNNNLLSYRHLGNLSRVINNSDFNQVSILLKRDDIDINQDDDRGFTPLISAIANRNLEIVKLLISKKNININKFNHHFVTPLIYAILKRDTDIVKILLEKDDIDVNQSYDFSFTPLCLAISLNEIDIVKLLLAHKNIAINKMMPSGLNALNLAICIGNLGWDNLEIIKLLLNHDDLDFNCIDQYGETPLIKAFSSFNIDKIELLLLFNLIKMNNNKIEIDENNYNNIDINFSNFNNVTIFDIEGYIKDFKDSIKFFVSLINQHDFVSKLENYVYDIKSHNLNILFDLKVLIMILSFKKFFRCIVDFRNYDKIRKIVNYIYYRNISLIKNSSFYKLFFNDIYSELNYLYNDRLKNNLITNLNKSNVYNFSDIDIITFS